MQTYKLLITPLAEADIDNMLDEIDHFYDLLEDNPFMGEQYITEGGTLYRFVLIKKYKLFYRITDNTILISRFLYAPSNYSSKLS